MCRMQVPTLALSAYTSVGEQAMKWNGDLENIGKP